MVLLGGNNYTTCGCQIVRKARLGEFGKPLLWRNTAILAGGFVGGAGAGFLGGKYA